MSMVMGGKRRLTQRHQSGLGWLFDKWLAYRQERKCGAESRNGGQTIKTEG